MLSAVSLIGRNAIPVKHFNCWFPRGTNASKLHVGASVSLSHRHYSRQSPSENSNALAEAKSSGGSEVSTATAFETVKETTKTAGNLGVILFGVGITASILWAIFQELFSGNSPNNIYSSALEKCLADSRVKDHLGEPIKAYGEETRRGRRRHVSHSEYIANGQKHMLLKFYIQGCRKKGTVFVDMIQDERGNYQRNLLVVDLDDFARTKLILEDNRQEQTNQMASEALPTLY